MAPVASTPHENAAAKAPDKKVSSTKVEKPIPIPLCILMPFPGFDSPHTNVVAQSQTEKLQTIINNVTKQQALVRNNIASLFEHQANVITAQAKMEAEALVDEDELHDGAAREQEMMNKELDAMIKRCKVSSRHYEKKLDASGYFIGDVRDPDLRRSAIEGRKDVNMSGMDKETQTKRSNPKTTKGVYQNLSKELKSLVNNSVSELQKYENHSKQVVAFYQHALDRRHDPLGLRTCTSSGAPPPAASRTETPLDLTRRFSTGMPVVGAPRGPMARSHESLEQVARRGSGRD